MNQNVGFFSEKCFACKKFVHRAMECRNQKMMNRMDQYFQGYYYICYDFGHKYNQYRSRIDLNQFVQRNVVCYTCNKLEHISKFCRIKIEKKPNPEKKKKKNL